MLKFFRKTGISSNQSFNEIFEREQQQKNEVAKRLVQDFPWLWAINNHHSRDDAESIKINQDMADLKTVLAQLSTKTRFSMWAITSQPCKVFNMRATCLDRMDDKIWAEVTIKQTFYHTNILFLVMVDSSPERVTIFRQPGKTPLNELVEHVCQLHGSNASWLIPDCID